MSKRKIKNKQSQVSQLIPIIVQKPNKVKALATLVGSKTKLVTLFCVDKGKTVGTKTKSTALLVVDKSKSASSKVKELIANIKAGEKLAEECEQVAGFIKEAADKAELLSAATVLRTQADTLEALARSK